MSHIHATNNKIDRTLPPGSDEEKRALLEVLSNYAQKQDSQRFSLKKASPAILSMINDPKEASAFLQKCGICDEHNQLIAPYK